MANCNNNQCSISSHSHSSSCGCGNKSCGCCSSDCKCGCHQDGCHHGDFAHELIQMADDAWMCLLKDKIKAKIENLSGKNLDELADLVANANHKRWISKMEKHEAKDDFEDAVADFFTHRK